MVSLLLGLNLITLHDLLRVISVIVSTPAPSFLIGSSSFLQVTRTTIKAWLSLNVSRIPPLTAEFAVIERLKN